MSSLYHLTAEYQALEQLAEEPGADEGDLDVISKWLQEVDSKLETKLEGCVAWAKSQELYAAMAKQEATRLNELARVRLARVQRLKAAVHFIFTVGKMKKIDTKLGPVRLTANGGVAPVLIKDESKIDTWPSDTWKTTKEPIKDALRKRLENGEAIEGVELGARGTRIDLG